MLLPPLARSCTQLLHALACVLLVALCLVCSCLKLLLQRVIFRPQRQHKV
jgi:hypothetical protein